MVDSKVTPYNDPALEQLAIAIFNRLNNLEAETVESYRLLTGADPSKAILDLVPANAYPLLCLAQQSAEGENFQRCRGTIEWILPANVARTGRSLAWIQKAIALAIREHQEFTNFDDLICSVDMRSLSSRQRVVVRGASVFWTVEIGFAYSDRATL